MIYNEPAPTAVRRTPRILVAVLLVVIAAITAALVNPLLATSSSTAAPPIVATQGDRPSGLGESGDVPDGVTVFDDKVQAVAKLDHDLLGALRQAATDAADDGVEFQVNSGWRSAEYQDQLLRKAISEYGSKEEAARWVATADTSPHVSGDAVDIGPTNAMSWLAQYGAEYGLCQIYGNEPWHYELRPGASAGSCPRMYADPTHDPRMQQ